MALVNSSTAIPGLRWGRIVLTAFALELVLFAVLLPIGFRFGMPGAGNGTNYIVFFVSVPVGCLGFGYLFGMWLGHRVASQHALHGFLLGATAMLIYLAVCSIPPNSISAAIAGYGPVRFWIFNGLRLVGCVAGSVHGARRT
jgi:hypothetical protein